MIRLFFHRWSRLGVFTLTAFLISSPAFAYIDPGSGSSIISVVIGFVVAIGVVIKTYWYKLKSIFSKPNDDKPSSDKPNQSD